MNFNKKQIKTTLIKRGYKEVSCNIVDMINTFAKTKKEYIETEDEFLQNISSYLNVVGQRNIIGIQYFKSNNHDNLNEIDSVVVTILQ